MDPEEKNLLEEANALKKRELDLQRTTLETRAALFKYSLAAGTGLAALVALVVGLSHLTLPWAIAIRTASGVAALMCAVGAVVEERVGAGVRLVVLAFIFALTF